MTTAAQHPHLTVVPALPTAAPTTPLKGVAVEKPTGIEKTTPAWLGAAVNHAKDNHLYLPLAGRGYCRLGAHWLDRYHDDYPEMIAAARRELREAPAEKQRELKALVRERRAEYRHHRLLHAGVTGAWAAAGGAGLTVGTLTGGLWADLAIGLGAYLFGLRHGVGDQPAAAILHTDSIAAATQDTPAISTPEDALLSALVKADIITAAERAETRIIGGIRQDGPGWAATIELPEGMPAIKATAKVGNLAGALRKKSSQIEFKPDTSETGHEGMVTLWVGDQSNPFAGPKNYSSLVDAPSWHFWRDGIPLGVDARQDRQTLNLIWSSILIGGLQDYGKTYLARLTAAAAALDPTVRIIVITGKKGPDWAPLKKIAHRYIAGSDPDTIREIFTEMNAVIGDMQARGDELERLFEKEPHRVPEGKITAELAGDGMGPVLVLVEELQELLGGAAATKMPLPDDDSENPRLVSAKPLLVDLFGRFNRAARFVLGMGVYITQRPDSASVPTELREVCVKRASFRTKSRESSEMILGDMAVAAGASPHALLESSKGVFVLEEGAEDGYRTLRGDVIDLPDFVKICERGKKLRLDKGTLTGDALKLHERAAAADEHRAFVARCLHVMNEMSRDAIHVDELAAELDMPAGAIGDRLRAAGVVRPDRVEIPGKGRVRGYDADCLIKAISSL
jgi:S-DNA-T family DNA segregation ATPase FtsK/SpoIIIE